MLITIKIEISYETIKIEISYETIKIEISDETINIKVIEIPKRMVSFAEATCRLRAIMFLLIAHYNKDRN